MDKKNKLPFEQRKFEILTKSESETDKSKGQYPENRSVDELLKKGIIILDKPSGPTSHQAVDFLKGVLKIKKAGHSGTLDPGVTGVLPVALNDATRITHPLLSAGKEYVCLMHFHAEVDDFESLRKKFLGTITQLPPKKSAVKRQLRKRTIYYLELLDKIGNDYLIKVGCQAGTYIRKLVHDMGLEAGSGAHMAELRRTKAGPFTEEKIVTLQDLADAFHYFKQGDDSHLKRIILPIEEGVKHLKKIWVHDSSISTLCNGAFLKIPGVSKVESDIKKGDEVAVLSLKGELILVGASNYDANQIIKLDRGIAVKTSQVFMKPGLY
ncbi:MAG: RNA-guided pseudouridylation complex pseudouridine synthase subunit Cbf5 [Candidatus Woesearchaeota archaeon]